MDDSWAVSKTEANLAQEKIDFTNDTHKKEVDYWKRAALGSKNEDERKQLTDQAHLRIFLAHKDAIKSGTENVYEILFYLKNNYLPHTEERAFTWDILQDDRFSFKEMSDYLIEVENMT